MIKKLHLKNFTAFDDLNIEFSQGINVFIGENGTGKTHIMKALYAACYVVNKRDNPTFAQKLVGVFLPLQRRIGRLITRSVGNKSGSITVVGSDDSSIKLEFTTKDGITEAQKKWFKEDKIGVTYIPVKDMLANAKGFRESVKERELNFEDIYVDIIDKAGLQTIKGKPDADRRVLLDMLHKSISGRVVERNSEYFLINKSGRLEFSLLAEGFRKLGLLWALIQNGSLTRGSVLFWDEPETNLNPKLAKTVVEILVKLQQLGVQIFIATHDYVFLKEFELAITTENVINYFSLYREGGQIKYNKTDNFYQLTPNAIDDTIEDMISRQMHQTRSRYDKSRTLR